MVIKNSLGLPEALVKAVTLSPHNKAGQYSATTLLKGTREILLTKRHWESLEMDVADNIWALFGTAVHAVLEEQETSEFKEEYLQAVVSSSVVTGRADSYCLDTKVITDYKTASTWKIKFADFDDWRRQGLIYAWLFAKGGLEVKKVRFIALLKDHSKTQAKIDATYPQSPVYVYEFDITPEAIAEIEAFILQKVEQLEACDNVADDDLPECTQAERWATDDTYAVKKEGRKSAVRVYETEAEANDKLAELGKGHYIEERKGTSKKCADYCLASAFCSQWKKEAEANG
ncbi:MAG TPA: DUF2188 domain-containing protein [bacterium]|nr:DUF2188 domain-containing protein [bacterium]